MPLPTVDALGWLAAGLTAATFACTEMQRLRLLALAANAAFIAYGAAAGLTPVLVLHLLLAPLNAWRLLHLWRAEAAAPLSPPVRPAAPAPTGARPRRVPARRRLGAAPHSAPRPVWRLRRWRPARRGGLRAVGDRP